MKVIEVISRWNKEGSRRVVEKDKDGKEFTKVVKNGVRGMAMCKVRLDNGQIVTRHVVA